MWDGQTNTITMKLSTNELAEIYKRKGKSPTLICDLDNSELPLKGSSTISRLQTLFQSRLCSPHPLLKPKVGHSRALDARKGIALCFVIVDELWHEKIWKDWCRNETNGKYFAQAFAHAKYPSKIRSTWVKERTLEKTFSPEWNSPEVVRAMIAVLQKALSDEASFDRFIFLTESCIPIYNIDYIGDKLFEQECSWLDAFKVPKSKWEAAACFDSVDKNIIPHEAVWKAVPGWIALTRKHALEMVSLSLDGERLGLQDLVLAWGPGGQYSEEKGGVFAPEEVYFPTLLALLGYLRDDSSPTSSSSTSSSALPHREVKRQSVNYAEFVKAGDANPRSFSYLSTQLVQYFRKSGALFARKFPKGSVSLEDWKRAVLQETHGPTDRTRYDQNNKKRILEGDRGSEINNSKRLK